MTQLRQRMLEDMRIRNFSENTQQSYLMQVSLFARHFRRSPEGLGPVNIRTYQVYMTNEKKLAPGSIVIATAALRFLYIVTLKRPWDVEEVLPMPKAPQTLPIILSPEEVRQFLSCVPRRKCRAVLTVFDHIDHHALMNRVRRRVSDGKLNRLIVAFLKAGVMSEAQFTRSDSGTPQGGNLSPLLANVALSLIEERYAQHVWPSATAQRPGARGRPAKVLTDPILIARRACANRANDRRRGNPVFMPIRYADDFIVLVTTADGDPELCRIAAEQAKSALGEMLLAELGLSLSVEKTLVTP
jgi:hypothetical protein